MSESILKLHALGQSIWYDNISRQMLANGELAGMIARDEIRGITSNPSIFRNAIANSHDYDAALVPMAWAGLNSEQIYEQLAIEDIRAACDLFHALYDESNAGDGYVSLEVSPRLAHDTGSTIAAAQRLWNTVNRPNLMIKIPATLEGLPAIRQSIAAGLNINVTLIFSIERYQQVMDAFLAGLEDRAAKQEAIDRIASVASFFVSRIDRAVDPLAPGLQGQIAIANARLAYQLFRKNFESPRFQALQVKGARFQRPLWASTSTKHNPSLPKAFYVEALIGPHTVDTVPPMAFEPFRDSGTARLTLESGLDEARKAFDELAAAGVSMAQVTQQLEDEGVKAFADDYVALLNTIEARCQPIAAQVGLLAKPVSARIAQFEKDGVVGLLWDHQAALWTKDPSGQEEVRRRMGWLTLPEKSRAAIPDLVSFAEEVRTAGIDHVLLLGMGGSSLAPEVISSVFDQLPVSQAAGLKDGSGVKFAILDSTDPAQVQATARRFPVTRTLYIVSSKSGSTAEVQAYLDFFWARAWRRLGKKAGDHFIAITDPGTSLEALARERKFRRTFSGDPEVGGRFSALSLFGLVPAALMGIDLEKFLDRAEVMKSQCERHQPASRNPGLVLGTIIGEAALQKRDKLTILADPALAAFGSWLEQLVAESSGKAGKGIVPVDLEPLAAPKYYRGDRLFIYLRSSGIHDRAVERLRTAGFPTLTFPISDPYDLAAEFYRWEFAVAVACAILPVNAFDQPDVQDSKDRTKARIKEYLQTGKLVEGEKVSVQAEPKIKTFLAQAKAGDYVALNAYLPRNAEVSALLRRLRVAIRRLTGCATTVGFGPRFLHSTGQLHKGGANKGIFLQITADPKSDIRVPGEDLFFGILERAQALGDLDALLAKDRRALRIHLGDLTELRSLVQKVEALHG